jgi:DNA modification methylase
VIAASVEAVDFAEVDLFPDFAIATSGGPYALRLSNNTTPYTHGLHRFPAKFIPHVPRWAIRQFSQRGDVVLDPFMGSGTTLVESVAEGRHAVGLDIDPLARMIASAKVTLPPNERLAELERVVVERWRPTLRPSLPMPDLTNFTHWFTIEAWRELDGLVRSIEAVAANDGELNFLLIVFSSILRWVSNADDQSQKTYVSGTNPKCLPAVRDTFVRFFRRAIDGAMELNAVELPGRAIVADGDAVETGLRGSSVDLIVTSPPYLDSVDYMYNFMLEYFWLGPRLGVPNRDAFNALRRVSIGAKNPIEKITTLPDALDDLVYFNGMAPARRTAATTYFNLMEDHFAEAARITRVGGHYVLVVGNSQTVGGVVPVHDCLIRLAHKSGFEFLGAFAYRIRRHYMKFPRSGRGGIILLDWVIVMKRSTKRTRPAKPLPLPWLTLDPRAVAN